MGDLKTDCKDCKWDQRCFYQAERPMNPPMECCQFERPDGEKR